MSTMGYCLEKSYRSSNPAAVVLFSPIFLNTFARRDLRSADTGVGGARADLGVVGGESLDALLETHAVVRLIFRGRDRARLMELEDVIFLLRGGRFGVLVRAHACASRNCCRAGEKSLGPTQIVEHLSPLE